MKTKQVLLKSFTFFLTLTLLFADISLASAKKKKKKGKKGGKFSKRSSKKSGSVSTPVPSTPAPVADSRAGYGNVVGYGRGSQQSPQQNMTPDQEIASLTDRLMACLSPVCEGSISYEKCFKTDQIDFNLVSSPDCASYMNSASSEDIKIMAKNNVKEKIKKYFTEACKEAGGKPSNSRCKFEIYYYAKSPDGKHDKMGAMRTLYAGQTLTCSYSDFQLSESDLQYELEMDAATKGALINSGIQMGMGVLNGGIKIFQASKTKKELETKEKGSAGCYVFNGNTLEKQDDACFGKIKACSTYSDSWKVGESKCFHKFENDVTQIEKQEKIAELIRSKVNL